MCNYRACLAAKGKWQSEDTGESSRTFRNAKTHLLIRILTFHTAWIYWYLITTSISLWPSDYPLCSLQRKHHFVFFVSLHLLLCFMNGISTKKLSMLAEQPGICGDCYMLNSTALITHLPNTGVPWHPWGTGSRNPLPISKSADIQVSYIRRCSICI